MDGLRSFTPSLALSLGLLFSARGVHAHGHDMSKIQDGEFVSEEPIVRGRCRTSDGLNTDVDVGRDTMDAYSFDDALLWHHISSWNGSGGMDIPPHL